MHYIGNFKTHLTNYL